jgi:hypothetical protein
LEKNVNNDHDKILKDLITLIELQEPYHVEQSYVDLVLTPPKEGTTIKISEELKPIICHNRYINKYAIPLLQACGINVDLKSDKRQGERRSTPVEENVDGETIIVQLYHFDDWENNPLPLTNVWFISSNNEEAKTRYAAIKIYLVEKLGHHILSHTCINRDKKYENKCLDAT